MQAWEGQPGCARFRKSRLVSSPRNEQPIDMVRVLLTTTFLLLATLCASHGQTQLHGHDDLFSQAFQNGPGNEEISDPFQVLRHNPELKAELSQAIRALEDKYQFRIRVLLRPVWMAGTVQELAITLQDVWFPQGDGLVMIIETDNRKLGLGVSMHGNPEERTWIMPTHASAAILKRVADRVNTELPLDDYLKNTVMDMVNEHDAFLNKRMAPPAAERALIDILIFIGAFSLTALGALLVVLWIRRARTKEKGSVLAFPVVSVPERLGAPYGGGTIAIRKFDTPTP